MRSDVLKDLSDLFFDETLTCSFCRREIHSGSYYCEECLEKLPYNNGYKCAVCGRRTPDGSMRCEHCAGENPHFDRAFSVFDYERPISGAILRLKYSNKRFIARELGETFLTFAYRKSGITADVIVYAPMFERDEKKRGFNQSRLLAEALGETIGVKTDGNVIFKTKHTDRQATLDRKTRAENLKNCFALNGKADLSGKTVLIVDDVMTTGATLNEMAKTLRKAGPKAIYCLTVASVPDREFLPAKKKKNIIERIKSKFFRRRKKARLLQTKSK